MPEVFSSLKTKKIKATRNGRQLFQLTSPLQFSLGINGGGIKVTVPTGFVTDFASSPQFIWPLVPPVGPYCEAAVVHDYLCGLPGVSRFLADAIFREAMAKQGVPTWRRVLMYYFVRAWAVLTARKRRKKKT